jgi:cyclophilin family peptidyl-prolyl cis-trans isomerase
MLRPVKKTILGVAFCLAASLAIPAKAQNSSNTFARFHITYGTTFFGDMDVELFDQEKPITVSNFLNYVRSGAYTNTIFHRASPITGPVVLQGGGYILLNPYSFEQWTCAALVPTNAPITNEFLAGPLRSNVYGTIAMAKVAGDPNSANSQWFFNLADNSANLDTNNGGFTVFGRVIRGTNVLNYFKTARANDGLYGEIPVAYRHSFFPPRPADLFLVQILELSKGDTRRPSVAITSPIANLRFSDQRLVVTGTASDDVSVREVWCYPDSCTRLVASGTNNWTLTLTNTPPGTNLILTESVDWAGNRSPVAKRSFFRVVPFPVGLQIVGNGTVTGATNGQLLEIGRSYVLTAVPAPRHIFAGWEARLLGDTNTSPILLSNPRVNVFMQSNLWLTASFVTNPFPPLKGTYSGLFFNTNVSSQPSGAITFNVTDQGKVSGKLHVLGRSLPFSGSLSYYGEANIRIPAASVAPVFGVPNDWYVRFILDVTNKSDRVFGPSDGTGYPYVWNPDPIYGFTSALSVNRVRPGTTATPSPYAGKYTLAISGSTNVTVQPGGDSFGAVTVNASGAAKFIGTLADGTPFTQSAPVSTNGLWPFYTSLYGGRGWMFGWVEFDFSRTDDDLHSQMHWRKGGPQPGKPYGNGFEFFPMLAGSRYTTATSTNRVLTFSNAVVALSGPNLAAPSTNHVFLNTNNTVLNLDTNKLTFAIVKPSGLFSGTVRPVGETRIIPFKGALLKKQDYGTGFYLSTNLSGRVYFGE